MWEQTAVSVEILDIVRRWLNRPRDGRVEVRIFGRSVLLVEWGGRVDTVVTGPSDVWIPRVEPLD